MFPTNKPIRCAVALIGIAACTIPAAAGSPNYFRPDYLSRRDSIWPSAGDAPAANLVIQTPNPWPPSVNNKFIPGDAWPAIVTIRKYYNKTLQLSTEGSTDETTSTGMTTTGAASQ